MVESTKKKILIVDDQDQIRNTYADVFEAENFEVIEAKDGIEGLDKAISDGDLDVIFTGIIMPRMDGFEMIKALKKNAITAKIPIFINSHLGREEDQKEAKNLGVKEFFIWGTIPPKEVVRVVNSYLNIRDYTIKIDPYGFDGQEWISNCDYPEDFLCENCGTELAGKVSVGVKNKTFFEVFCPNCQKRY